MHTPRTRRSRACWQAALLLAALAGSARAGGLVFTVNTPDDLPDAALADPACDADINEPGNQITLRAAVMQANHENGPDSIVIPDGLWKLTLKGAGEDDSATGDLDVTDDLTIMGTPADPQAKTDGTIVDGKKLKDRLFEVAPGATLTLQGLTLRNGKAPKEESGGAVRVYGSLVMDHVVVRTCKSTVDGGAIVLVPAAVALTLNDVLFFKNNAGGDGGAIDANGGLTQITATTFHKNHAGGEGGALEVTAAFATLTNVTLGFNSAKSDGGAVSLENGSVLTLIDVTSSANSCKLTSGISGIDGGSSMNTVLARNVIFDDKGARNASGAIISLGGNLDSGIACNLPFGELSSTDPLLLKLKDYGGFTPTFALEPESLAIDSGSDNGSPPTDQRGIAHVDIDGVGLDFVECDAGAFEFTPAAAP